MMSGSSHAGDRQLLDMVRDKSLPSGELVTASVLVEPTGCKQQFGSRRGSVADEEAITPAAAGPAGAVEETPPPNGRRDGGGDSEDRTDFVPRALASHPPKPDQTADDEDGCGVKCLYYTMQCCECTLM